MRVPAREAPPFAAPRRGCGREPGDGTPDRRVGQGHAGQRITRQVIATGDDDHRLGLETVGQGQYRGLEQELELAVVEATGNRHVASIAAAPVVDRTAVRPASAFVNGNGEDPFVAVEGILDPIPVVGIEIDVENAFHPVVEKGQDSQRHVIEIAKPASPIGTAMMGAAGRVEGDATAAD